MNQTSDITKEQVLVIYSWFQSAMKQVGRNIKFPRCEDLTKTYQYRWTKIFAERCYHDFELDDRSIKNFVYDIVDYARSRSLLGMGTQILCLNNLIEICYHSLEESQEREDSLISEITRCHNFLVDQGDSKDIRVRKLIEPVSRGGYSNLVYWCESGYLTIPYVAISLTCQTALYHLSEDERVELPSDIELLKTCTQLVSRDSLPLLKEILGSDLRIPPTAN